MSASGFPGRRVDAYRAGMITENKDGTRGEGRGACVPDRCESALCKEGPLSSLVPRPSPRFSLVPQPFRFLRRQLARFVLEQHRDAVADRISEARGSRDQLLALAI